MRCRRIDGDAPPGCPSVGELDALVRLVVDEAAVGEALDRGGDRAGRQAEPLGQDPVWASPSRRKPVNGLQRLAIGFGEGFHLGFDGRQSKFWLTQKSIR